MDNRILDIVLTNLIMKRDMLEEDLKQSLNVSDDTTERKVAKIESVLKELTSVINMTNVWSSYLPPQGNDDNK
tara:strand:+ start:634 stop:852 length:219 start_codon:yes stop_codon:yes gene_type:complete